MTYGYKFERLLNLLWENDPQKARSVQRSRRQSESGLLPVGLKLHVLDSEIVHRFLWVIDRLGGPEKVVRQNVYRHAQAGLCFVLHPMGSASTAVSLVELLEKHLDCSLIGNPGVQIQVCSPGRLDARRAALLGMCFYLSSDTLRNYQLEDFQTTVSYDGAYQRGRRLLLYDAGGDFDAGFEWASTMSLAVKDLARQWFAFRDGTPKGRLPFRQRTDVLATTASRQDIHNINLAATLLCHAQYPQYQGYFRELGEAFEREVMEVISAHMLTGLVGAPWIADDRTATPEDDQVFIAALQELVAYTFSELKRVHHSSSSAQSGVLYAIDDLLAKYRRAATDLYDGRKGVRA